MNGYSFIGSKSGMFIFVFHLNKKQLLTHCIVVDSSMLYVGQIYLSFEIVGSILLLKLYFLWKILLANNVGPDQTPYDVSLHCLSVTLLRVSR